ncbi:Serine/threonine-protein kinase AfsK [Nonomuraea coxensis DSM 45129]|uniref:Serine/threonine-protein kinase AfsK n=1 Tax=Nonomuraea coxensis DSM 45129 TaxID=1122611 RepID=A0ABX8TYH3_9ACTN|nr:serine/threonine-protein kinase [Nonomuraea coxensis]QYC39507.1 Serine/threonine-protein kinase AfsK [Nonomuraea coxensis DSM 45129]
MSELRPDDPRHLGSYRLSRRLGQGGQGVVYLGHSPQGAQVAVKLLHAGLAADPVVRRRFLGEVEAVRRVAAFCTAQLLDADLEGDRPYLVSEYVEGPSLGEHVTARGPRLGGSLDRLAIGTATALGAIHRAGVVHRDFKPGNVLLGLDGPRVIDFGVSRLVSTAVTTGLSPVGTPAYLPPERIKGEVAGPPADLWAWALTVAYTASGRHAYTGETYQEVLARILFGRPDLGPLTGRLREIVEACLAPEPGDRPDAEEVLRRLLGQDGAGGDVLTSGAMAAVPPRPDTTAPRPVPTTDPAPTTAFPAITRSDAAFEPRPARRRPRVWQVAVGLAGLAMAVGGAVYWLQGARGPGLAGTWTGSAEHVTAGRVFPVELRLGEDGAGTMRWGSDLHCSGRVARDGGTGTVYALHRVAGDQCYPGTLRLLPTSYADQLAIKVTREGQEEVTYSGTVTRTS